MQFVRKNPAGENRTKAVEAAQFVTMSSQGVTRMT